MSENCNQNCGDCTVNCESRKAPKGLESFREAPHPLSNIKKVIGVVSGKGGVGKSLTSALLAVLLNRRGHATGIMDADITGPSIPRLFGIQEQAKTSENAIWPAESKTGIQLMSVNLLLENETDPVVWRGPVIAGMVKQFWQDVVWRDLDFLFIDMPPGTGDVPLTAFQIMPLDGIVVVTSPQQLVNVIVSKAVKMANLMNVPVLGLVENMSYIACPDCGKHIHLYGESHAAAVAAGFGLLLLARLPVDPALASAADKGVIELFEGAWLDEAATMLEGLLLK